MRKKKEEFEKYVNFFKAERQDFVNKQFDIEKSFDTFIITISAASIAFTGSILKGNTSLEFGCYLHWAWVIWFLAMLTVVINIYLLSKNYSKLINEINKYLITLRLKPKSEYTPPKLIPFNGFLNTVALILVLLGYIFLILFFMKNY
ncbi:MAG: hypothetical protein JNJ85_04340 [Candidatus Kapabacteria bacterium]|nr:hypothetical protein [Candidatus Kapabacteria bacterium]MBX7153406.1 hypothetical protein [Bacteroidota bacterium]